VGKRVLVVFVFDADILDALPDRDDRRVVFLAESVAELDRRLRTSGGGVLVLHGSARREIPRLVADLGGVPVFASRDHEPFGIARDAAVGQEMSKMSAALRLVDDLAIAPPGVLRTGSGGSYRVFTPYFRSWTARLERDPEGVLGERPSSRAEGRLSVPEVECGDPDSLLARIGFRRPFVPGPPGGETAARNRLATFLARVGSYAQSRDLPGTDGTSRMSIDLRFGTISVRELVRRAREVPSPGAAKWVAEIAWRDFYQDVLHHFPETVDQPFQTRLAQVAWDDPEVDPVAAARFEAWKRGATGYPFIDAAMRELAATGWMHNRCRMVVASFLTKDLHIHWKRGERWFARHLVDIELASNVGGWQWAASTGADGQPWFRVFHPVEQGRRWDPQGTWIRKWCPELVPLPDRWLHAPWEAPEAVLREAGVVLGQSWPRPIVDHAAERREALERFGRIARAD
jgi:deoxyribodipyrimidine photo-lyase